MTLVVAIKTNNGIVIAADTMGVHTETGKTIYTVNKIRPVENQFVIGLAGNVLGESMLDDIQSRAGAFIQKNKGCSFGTFTNYLGKDLNDSYGIWATKNTEFTMEALICSSDDLRIITIYPKVEQTPIYNIASIGINDSIKGDYEKSDYYQKVMVKSRAVDKVKEYMRMVTQQSPGAIGGKVEALYITRTGISVLPCPAMLGNRN